jgi:hypothetical protein
MGLRKLFLGLLLFIGYIGHSQPMARLISKRASGVSPSSNEWNVEINNTLCGTANSDTFTVLVKLQSDSLKPTYKGGLTSCLSGNDIRFYVTDTNTLLNWAKERYDPDSGIVIMWVKIYSVSNSTNTTFKMDVGRTYDTSTFHGGSTGTAWKSTVVAAYFMNDATGNNLTDNSSYGNTGTQTNSPVLTSGQVGYSESFSSASTMRYAATLAEIKGVANMSMVMWAKRNSTVTSVIAGSHSGTPAIVGYVYSDGVIYFQLNAAYGYFTNSTANWQHYGFVYNGGGSTNADKCKIYLSGSNQSLSFVGTIPTTTSSSAGNFNIGKDGSLVGSSAYYSDGRIDACIIYKETVSSSWMTTMYNNQNNPGNLGSAGFLRFYH